MFIHGSNSIWEAQLPPYHFTVGEFKERKQIVEDYLRSNGVNSIWGMTHKKMGDFLILTDSRIKWQNETIQVGYNKKQKIVWDLQTKE